MRKRDWIYRMVYGKQPTASVAKTKKETLSLDAVQKQVQILTLAAKAADAMVEREMQALQAQCPHVFGETTCTAAHPWGYGTCAVCGFVRYKKVRS